MEINAVMEIGGPKKAPLVPTGPRRISSVNLSGEAMRQHEQLMAYRNKVNALNSNLSAAMASLESANQDIDRLNAEIASLRAELQKEREKNSRLSASKKQSQRQKLADDAGSSS